MTGIRIRLTLVREVYTVAQRFFQDLQSPQLLLFVLFELLRRGKVPRCMCFDEHEVVFADLDLW